MKTKSNHMAKALRILCAMVFLSLGFGHRMPVAIAADVQAAAYSLPDGTFADLCTADRGQSQGQTKNDCEACRLSGSVILPEPGDGWLLSVFTSLGEVVTGRARTPVHHVSDQPRSRGPPLLA